MSLLSLCHLFSFHGIFYQLVFGTAMGSPVSIMVANLVTHTCSAVKIKQDPGFLYLSLLCVKSCYIATMYCIRSAQKTTIPTCSFLPPSHTATQGLEKVDHAL